MDGCFLVVFVTGEALSARMGLSLMSWSIA